MATYNCKICGGTLLVNEGDTVGTCDHCGTQQTLPRLDSEKKANLFGRANHYRRNNEFDKAMGYFEQVLAEDTTDAEAYWSLVLCRYGVEYVEDPATHKRVPTVNRAQFTSIFDDENYKAALNYANGLQRMIYEDEARAINEIQKGILAISQQEEPFDVFICYKESDAYGRRTQDSVLANDLYHQLTQEGFKVFFARITLEDKLGTAYEPYIFAALNSAKVMVVLGTKSEYFNAVWVKNEWSRYLALIKSGANKTLIPAYRDMDPYDLPEEFSHLQAQDMSKLGFMQDLVRGIRKIASDEVKPAAKESGASREGGPNVSALLKRGYMALEDREWNKADDFFEQVLNMDAECAEAYAGKLMVELRVGERFKLFNCQDTFDSNKNYIRAVRYADDALKAELTGYIEAINNRNAHAKYQQATDIKNKATTEAEFKNASALLHSISWFRDATQLAEECDVLAENCRKETVYQSATKKMVSAVTVEEYLKVAEKYGSIKGWKDSDELCRKSKEEAGNLRGLQDKVSQILIRWKQLDTKEDSLKEELVNAFALKKKKIDKEFDEIGQERLVLTNQLKQIPVDIAVRAMASLGDIILFGEFPQYKQGVKTAIAWKIIARDGRKLLVTSAYAVACMPFHNKWKAIEWETCALRDWLNVEFYQSAFTNKEKPLVLQTNDAVFLMSRGEVLKYMPQKMDRRLLPTVYADISRKGYRGTAAGWWLRTMAENGYYAEIVYADGSTLKHGQSVNSNEMFVRPAMWISI